MERIKERVKQYWTRRARDFSDVRRMELKDEISGRWLEEIRKYLPKEKRLKILDVGTGAGYFAVLLAKEGHEVWGVDITPAMIEEAKKLAADCQEAICFQVMDAQKLEFPDEMFDVVIARNLTWTLPQPHKAYREWLRVLSKGGVLLNFDADYGREVFQMESEQGEKTRSSSGYHKGLTEELLMESDQITKAMDISRNRRPEWDLFVLRDLGVQSCECDTGAGARILREQNGKAAPTFLITVRKQGESNEAVRGK
ncbi:class I SAM-dependent methyltransferase [Lacrimispora sp. JR3]|uniref:class I SAM-dependent methyltransferase n=1 Tax=Lacrimispora sinapis TaxID=3111456 RepID=UPI0037490C27